LSEEYPVFVGSEFNDAFIAELQNSNWSVSGGGEISRANDFATSLEGFPASVNGAGPGAMSPVEAAGTYFNAATGLITTKTPVSPGEEEVALSIFDAGDQMLDSAAFIDNMRFVNESPETCKPPTSKQLEIQTTPPPPSNAFTLGSSVKFKNSGTS